MMRGVWSEVGKLEKVLVHRPGSEIDRLTPSNREELLFDDILWLEKAREDHDTFSAKLASQGTQVVYLQDLLAEVLDIAPARKWLLEQTIDDRHLGVALSAPLREFLAEQESRKLAQILISGLTRAEIEAELGAVASTVLARVETEDFILAPLLTTCLPAILPPGLARE